MRPNVPEALEDRIIDAKIDLGYSTKTDFVLEAVRLRLEELDY